MLYSIKKNNKAFTLVEVIIYTSLLGLLTTGLVSFSFLTTGLYAKGRSMEEVLSSARQIERIVNYYIKKESTDIIFPLASSASSSLEALLPEGYSVKFYLENNRFMLQLGSAEPLAVTTNETIIRDLNFQNFAISSDFSSLRVSCLISFAAVDSVEFIYNYDFNMTVNTRN